MDALLHFLHIPMDSHGGNSCISLCCSQICVSEHTAHRFYRYTRRECDERSKGVASHVKGQRSFHPDVSLYVVHAIENNVGGRHIKDKTSPYASIAIHDSQCRGKHLDTVWCLGLHAPTLDADFAFFQDDVFLPKIADIGNCQS